VDPDLARDIIAALPPFVTAVGLFVDHTLDEVRAIAARTGIDLLQFHGDESPAFCAQAPRAYLKAVKVRPGFDLAAAEREYAGARALLVDAWHPELPGGTGQTFDWHLLEGARTLPLILAGGLTAANVAGAIRSVRPHAVDVSGGVESCKGIKDPARMREFFAEVATNERHA
jgi:phosphoribosylanthranilate isomerase